MKHCFSALFLAALFISCTNENLENVITDEPRVEVDVVDDGIYVPGEAHVYFSDDMIRLIEADLAAGAVKTKSDDLNQVMEALGITEMRRLFPHAGEFEPRTRKEGLHKWYIVKYSAEMPQTKAQEAIAAVSGVEVIEPVRRIKINDFNDLTSKLWGLHNTSVPGADINVLPVWNNYTTGNPNVIVSVVDGGVDIAHEDLAANCLPAGRHYNSINDNNSITPEDHGTHVAGTIAAVSNNGKGLAGIAGGDAANGKGGVKILSSQIFAANSDKSGNSAAAIKWGADHGAVISQNSWGYIYDFDGDGAISTPEEIEAMKNSKISGSDKAAVDYFIKYAGCDNDGNQLNGSPMKGGVVFFAAGNDAVTNGAPANYEPVIAVGAIAPDGTKASFSNYGPWVDIAAPGESIYSTVPGNQYKSMNGTSMACPHVSGVAALVVSYFGGPGFTNEMLEERLLGSMNTTILSPAYQVGGLVDAYGAFVYGKQVSVDAVTDLEVSGRGNNIDLTWTATADSDGEASYGYLVMYSDDRAVAEAATPADHGKAQYLACTPDAAIGEKVDFTVPKLDFEKTYYVKVYAYSYSRSYSDATALLTVATTANNAPVISLNYEGSFDIKASQTLQIPVSVVEPDGHASEVSYENGSAADVFMPTPDGNWRITIKGSDAPEGTYTAKVKAVDEFGLEAVKEVTYTILGNSAPVKVKDIENVMLTGKGKEFSLDMTQYASDPDGDALKYDVTVSDPQVVHIVAKGDQLSGTAMQYGTTDVVVKAKDAKGEYVELAFKVNVKDPSSPLSVYPNPVTDFVNVGTLDPADTRIRIISQTGQTVYDQTSVVSGYDPARIDMTSCAPGVYVVAVEFGGNEFKQNIVKL